MAGYRVTRVSCYVITIFRTKSPLFTRITSLFFLEFADDIVVGRKSKGRGDGGEMYRITLFFLEFVVGEEYHVT